MSVLLFVHQKKENFSPSLLVTLISLPVPIVLVLHSSLTSRPRQIAGKREELRIKKTQTLTTDFLHSHSIYITRSNRAKKFYIERVFS